MPKAPLKFNQVRMKPKETKYTHKPNKNANAILSLLPDAVMMALVIRGPINAEVFPTCRAQQPKITI